MAELCWTPAPAALGPDGGEQPAVQLYSLSADGTLLLWGPVPLPLIDLFSSGKAAGGSNASSSSAASWSAPASRPGAAALASPVDVRTHLAAAAAAAAAEGGASAAWLSSQPQLSVTAFAVLQPGSPAADAAGGRHLLAIALAGGGVALFSATGAAAAGGEPLLRLLWANGGASGAPTVRCEVRKLSDRFVIVV